MKHIVTICMSFALAGCQTMPEKIEEVLVLPPASSMVVCDSLLDLDKGTIAEILRNREKEVKIHISCMERHKDLILFVCDDKKLDLNVCKELREEKNANKRADN